MQVAKLRSVNLENGEILEQSGLRRHNLGIIFRAIRDSGPISRAQLAQITGMTKPGVTNIVDELLDYLGERVAAGGAAPSFSGGESSGVAARIAAGYSADIIAVDGDPIQDVATLMNVRYVMARGVTHKSE